MSEFVQNDWSKGLISSDDDVNGRKNGLLRMENVELDQNGAIVLTGGTVRLNSAYGTDLHTIFSKFLGTGDPESPQFQYGTDTSGVTYRNNTNIGGSGSASRTAFLALFEYVLYCSGATRKKDDGTTASALGQGTASAITAVTPNAAGVLNASYDYCQVNVFVNSSGGYQARSAPSTVTTVVPANQKVDITPSNVAGIQNEVWIFRRGGNLDQFYRVKRITSSYTTLFSDNSYDQDVLNSGITLNLLAVPVDSTNLTDDILEMVGPVKSRVLFFTKNAVYCSEPNSPESYVPGQGVFFMGAPQTAEAFLFAKKVANNIVLIGTTKDVYRMTGNYITQSDGTLDISIVPLGVDAPPLSKDAAVYQNELIYMGAYGWVLCDQYGRSKPLCPPNVDVNYYGKTRYGIAGVPILQASTNTNYRYSCAVIRNKLFCIVPELPLSGPGHRVDVYDFVRDYWRSIRYVSDAAPLMIKEQEDHTLIGYFASDKFIKRLDDQFVFTFANNATTKQTVTLRTPFYDCQLPRNRKDVETLKFKIDTGGDNVALGLYIDGNGTSGTSLGNISSNGMTEVTVDINSFFTPNVLKSFQLTIQGTVGTFRLSDFSLTYQPRPEQKTFHRILNTNFGIASKKRVRTWPFVLDTLGGTVIFTPNVDGSDTVTSSFSNAVKKTFFHFFKTDVFGVDYGGVLSSPTLFEVYEPQNPELVQQLPAPKRFDQIGPLELFRYGKIREVQIALIAFSGTVIPYNLYFQDASQVTGNLTLVDSVEDVYSIQMPKNIEGDVIRIELGPTTFNFHRIKARVKVQLSGKDTEMKWYEIGINKDGSN